MAKRGIDIIRHMLPTPRNIIELAPELRGAIVIGANDAGVFEVRSMLDVVLSDRHSRMLARSPFRILQPVQRDP